MSNANRTLAGAGVGPSAVPPEPTLLDPPPRRHLRLVPRRPLTVVDCAVLTPGRSPAIRAYLQAKAEFARGSDEIDHHVLVPPADGGLRLDGGGLPQALDRLDPDVVLLHDPFRKAREVCRLVHAKGGVSVMVDHGTPGLDGPPARRRSGVHGRALSAWARHAYDEADAVMSAGDPFGATGRAATLRLRFGLDPAFRPQRGLERGDHVLYAGRIAPERGVLQLLEAMARSHGDWTLRLVGDGPDLPGIRARARELGVLARVEHRSFVHDRRELAREFAAARCVVVPAPGRSFGLAALEAAACGTPVAVGAGAPAAAMAGDRAVTFADGDTTGLLRALGRARLMPADPEAGVAIATRFTWERAFREELRELETLARW